MSALGHKRTLKPVRLMSALPPKADIKIVADYVRVVAPANWRYSPRSAVQHCGSTTLRWEEPPRGVVCYPSCYPDDVPLPDLLYFVVILGPGGQEMDNADPPIRLGNSPAPLV
jgi:hypothetical protein